MRPWPFADPPRADLARRLRQLGRVFEFDPIASLAMGPDEVAAYYHQCFHPYRRHHSGEGAVHMALNAGTRFDTDGFYEAPRRIERDWAGEPPARVLELGFGHGFNLAYLAPRWPGVRFAGLDLTPRHLRHVQALLAGLGTANVELAQGDFHAPPYADDSFDAVFAIEAFCHATDTPRALAALARLLRPGGRLTLFDGYLARPLAALDADEALAVRLIAKGMAVEEFQVVDELQAQADAAGLEPLAAEPLDAQVMPSLRRLERRTGAVVRLPWLGRRLLARRSALRGRNVLSGYLMRSAVQLGLLGYRRLDFRRRT